MKTFLKRTAARLGRSITTWCFGPTEVQAEPGAEQVTAAPRVTTVEASPFVTAEGLRQIIAEAAGVPVENVKLLPLRVHPCTCPQCCQRRKMMQVLRPHPN